MEVFLLLQAELAGVTPSDLLSPSPCSESPGEGRTLMEGARRGRCPGTQEKEALLSSGKAPSPDQVHHQDHLP